MLFQSKKPAVVPCHISSININMLVCSLFFIKSFQFRTSLFIFFNNCLHSQGSGTPLLQHIETHIVSNNSLILSATKQNHVSNPIFVTQKFISACLAVKERHTRKPVAEREWSPRIFCQCIHGGNMDVKHANMTSFFHNLDKQV